jgi:hypothetical protein
MPHYDRSGLDDEDGVMAGHTLFLNADTTCGVAVEHDPFRPPLEYVVCRPYGLPLQNVVLLDARPRLAGMICLSSGVVNC